MKCHVPVLYALLASWALLPVGAQAQAQAQASASQANALEREVENLLRCGRPNIIGEAISVMRELGFMYDGETYQPPKGKQVIVFGEEVLEANAHRDRGPHGRGGDHGGSFKVVLKGKKMELSALHPIAKRMGFSRQEFHEEELTGGYRRDVTRNTHVSLELGGPIPGSVTIRCEWQPAR